MSAIVTIKKAAGGAAGASTPFQSVEIDLLAALQSGDDPAAEPIWANEWRPYGNLAETARDVEHVSRRREPRKADA